MKKELRQQVYEKYGGHCAYCGCELEFGKMQVDHFKAQVYDKEAGRKINNDIDNLMPACAECNRYKAEWSIEVMREWLQKSKQQLLKTQNLRILHRMGGFEISNKPLIFYFEKWKKA